MVTDTRISGKSNPVSGLIMDTGIKKAGLSGRISGESLKRYLKLNCNEILSTPVFLPSTLVPCSYDFRIHFLFPSENSKVKKVPSNRVIPSPFTQKSPFFSKNH
jgi:hypothetical protein